MHALLLAALLGMPRYWMDGTLLHQGEWPNASIQAPVARPAHPPGWRGPAVGDQASFWAIDYSVDPPPYNFYLTSATCRFVGEHSYIFVEDSQWGVNYSQEAVDALAAALEDSTPSGPGGIMQNLTDVLGPVPDALDGDPKVYFLVLDIRDGYDPAQGGGYIGGFFSPWNQYEDIYIYPYHSNEIEMLYIDCNPSYESDAPVTCAHEMVHLISYGIEQYSGEDLWVLENQAQTGDYICGYPAFQIWNFLDEGGITPVGWTEFPDIYRLVAGYGAGYLFFSYLYERYGGGDFIYGSMHSTQTGLAGVAEAIEGATGQRPDMDAILRDWMLACWIDDSSFGDGRYGWQSFTIAQFDTVDPGNRPGLDYRATVGAGQFTDPSHPVGALCSNGYEIEGSAEGSFRASAMGIGDLQAYFLPSGQQVLQPLPEAQGGDVAMQLPAEGTALLLCSSFDGFDLEAAAGSVVGSSGSLAVFPQPCFGTLYLQFNSAGGPVALSVISTSGQHVETLELGDVPTGEAVIPYIGASELATGVYFYRLAQGGTAWTGRFAVVR
jgi:hypothetical protein